VRQSAGRDIVGETDAQTGVSRVVGLRRVRVRRGGGDFQEPEAAANHGSGCEPGVDRSRERSGAGKERRAPLQSERQTVVGKPGSPRPNCNPGTLRSSPTFILTVICPVAGSLVSSRSSAVPLPFTSCRRPLRSSWG